MGRPHHPETSHPRLVRLAHSLYLPVMRIGISLTSTHRAADRRTGPAVMIERAAAAHRAGLDSLSVGDHHVQPHYVQNTPMLGRVLAEWHGRPAGCLFLVPLWHPVLMAEQIGTLAAIHDGPFFVQTGLGWGEGQFAGMGVDMRTRPSRFEEAVRVVRELLNGDTVSSVRFGMRDAFIGLTPPEPVTWSIGAGADAGIDRAARLGDGYYAPPGPVQEAIERLEVYRGRCEHHGRPVGQAAVRADVIVTADPAAAHRFGDELMAVGYRGLDREAVHYGSVEEVAERLAPLRDAGYDEVVTRCMFVPQAVALETIELLAEVREALR